MCVHSQITASCTPGICVALVGLLIVGDLPVASSICLFIARALVGGCYAVTWVFTMELYPTAYRAATFGFLSAFSRSDISPSAVLFFNPHLFT